MRQVASVLTITAVLLASAFTVDAEKLSVNRQNSHNAKRVVAKLQHVSGARDMLERRLQRLKKPEMDIQTPEMKATKATIAREQAELNAKIADIESRQMNVQATSTAPPPSREQKPGITSGVQQFFDAPHCNSASTFRVLETRFHDVCARTDFSFVRRHWQDLGRANNAYEKFCTSACAGTINDLLLHTEGYTCFHSDVLTELRLFSAMCQLSTNIPPGAYWQRQRCGAEVAVSGVFDGITSPCEAANTVNSKSMCDSQPGSQCQWDSDMMMCTERITPQLIQRECSDCYVKIVDVLAQDFNSVCAKKTHPTTGVAEFCLPKLFQFNRIVAQHNTSFSNAMFDAVCQDPLMLPCFQSQDVGFDNKDISDARATYTQCQKAANVALSNNDAIRTACATAFQKVQQRITSNSMFWSQLCTKSVSGPSGEYCYRSSQGLTLSNYAGSANCDLVSPSSSCGPASCATPFANFLQDAGCCAPYYDFVPMTKASDFPQFGMNVVKASDLGRKDTDYHFYGVSAYETCSSSTLFDWQAAMCPNPRRISTPIEFFTVLDHNAVLGSGTQQQDKIMFALKLDIGKAAGVLVTALSVSLRASTTPGMPGTYVAFTIQGTAGEYQSAKTQWDAAASHRAMSRTDEAIRMCRTCKPDTEASIVPRVFDSIPDAPSDSCNTQTFFDAYKLMVVACSSVEVDAVFGLSTGDLFTANAGWNLACNSQCANEFTKLKKSAYGTCIPNDVLSLGSLMIVGCTFDNNQNRCGAVLSVMGGTDCNALDEPACRMHTGAGAQCRWNNKTSSCKDQFKSTFLQPLCDGGCITRMAATIGMNGDSFGKEAKLLDSLFCSKDGAMLCMPLIQNEINDIDEFGLTVKVVRDVCEHREKLRCMKRVYAAIGADSLGFAEEDFYHCVESVLDDASVSHYQKVNRIETNCIENVLAATLSAVDQTNAMLDNMCSKNQAGKYCMSFPAKYGDNQCLTNMLFNNECGSDCTSQIDTILYDLGCCTGNLQQVHGFLPFANLPQEDVPEFEVFEDFGDDFGGVQTNPPQTVRDFQGPQPGSAGGGAGVGMVARPSNFMPSQNEDEIMTPKWYFFSNYQTCRGGNFMVGDLIYKKCKKVRGSIQENRTLNLGISYEAIASTARKQKRFEKKLQSDLSVKLGLSADDFPSLGMKRDLGRNINLAPAGGPPPRGNRRSTTTTSAASSSISMQTENDADTTASATAYDTAVADGSLTLSSATSLVKNECSNCTSDYSAVSTTSTAVTTTSPGTVASSSAASGSSGSTPSATPSTTSSSTGSNTGNGAAATSVVAAVLAAVIAALAF